MTTSPGRGSAGSVSQFLVASAVAVAAGVVAACGAPPPTVAAPAGEWFDVGVAQLAAGNYGRADTALRESASRCESGSDGRRALLLLAQANVDPRNPDAHPDTAALMAGRVLLTPDARPDERLTAEALYVAALDRGADPGLRPDPAGAGFSTRFERCGDPPGEAPELVLPGLESPTTGVVGELASERDALKTRNEELTRKIAELEAELDRIRKLLRLPDTTSVGHPRGS